MTDLDFYTKLPPGKQGDIDDQYAIWSDDLIYMAECINNLTVALQNLWLECTNNGTEHLGPMIAPSEKACTDAYLLLEKIKAIETVKILNQV